MGYLEFPVAVHFSPIFLLQYPPVPGMTRERLAPLASPNPAWRIMLN